MKRITFLLLLAVAIPLIAGLLFAIPVLASDGNCGEGNAGTLVDEQCLYPPAFVDRVNGPTPADTGSRQVFHTENYTGTPEQKIAAASYPAKNVGGAVIIDQIYEVTSTVYFQTGVMYTGGGLKRATSPHTVLTVPALSTDRCVTVSDVSGFYNGLVGVQANPNAAGGPGTFRILTIDTGTSQLCAASPIGFNAPAGAHVFRPFILVSGAPQYSANIVIDSVLFDGNAAGNPWTHDWRFNDTLKIRSSSLGSNIIRNSYFFDTPAENMTICRDIIENNVASNLSGSFVHKSCGIEYIGPDEVTGNYVEYANQIPSAVTGHSEGLVTFSANANNLHVSNNVFRYGNEGVYGAAASDDAPLESSNNYFAHFPRLISYQPSGDPSQFHFINDTLNDVTFNSPVINPLVTNRIRGTAPSTSKIATVTDVEGARGTISVSAVDANGISVTNIQNVAGNINATVGASCTTPLNQNAIMLTAQDITGMTGTASLIVTVSDNTVPKLGVYPATTTTLGSSKTIVPSLVPSDNGTITSLVATGPANFTGTLSVDPISGNVTVTNAGPTGVFTITVTATDNCAAVATKTFKLTVQ